MNTSAFNSHEIAKAVQALDSHDIFRFTYAPFVVAELAWDYADTILIIAKQLHLSETKRLSRIIKEARREYCSIRFKYSMGEQRQRLEDNMYLFEDALKPVLRQMSVNVTCDIKKQYPELEELSSCLLQAIIECEVVSNALVKFVERQVGNIQKKIGVPVKSPLPQCYMLMHKLIPEFYGDKPLSDKFQQLKQVYIDTLAAQMGLITYKESNNKQ